MHKILYFHHVAFLGGAPRSLAYLLAGLDRELFSATVVLPKRANNKEAVELFEATGAEVIQEQNIRPFHGSEVARCATLKERAYAAAGLPLLVKSAYRILKEVQPDIVHLNSTCLFGAAIAAGRWNPDTPVIAHVREPLLNNRWGRMLAAFNRRYVDYYISIDQYGMDSLGLSQPSGQVIRNFVSAPTDTFTQQEIASTRASLGVRPDEVLFLSLARVTKPNGTVPLAQTVLQQADALDARAKFVVAGFTDESSDYAAEAKRLVESSPRCVAVPFTNEVDKMIACADVIVAPFLTPHSARSVLEAASRGKPVLVSNVKNLLEMIDDGRSGLVFDWGDPQTFVDSVNRLCDADHRARLADGGREFARQNFDPETNIRRTQQVYLDLLGQKVESNN